MADLDHIPMDPTCPRCDKPHGIEVSGDGYEWDCSSCHGHLICAIGPDGGEMYSWHREDGTCGCNSEPHTCGDDGDFCRKCGHSGTRFVEGKPRRCECNPNEAAP